MPSLKTPRNVLHVYVDESSQTGHPFMVIGAIFCRKDAAQDIAADMDECLVRHGQRSTKEFHWNELTSHTLGLYKDVLSSLIGSAITRRKMRYRALIVEMSKVDSSLDKHRSREALLAKFIFTLVFGFARNSGPNARYQVWVDKRPDSVDDIDMDRRILRSLNDEAKSRFGWAEGPFVAVRFVDSKRSRLIQAVDLITGAVAYETNRKHEAPDASNHRVALLEHAIKCSTLSTLSKPTACSLFGLCIRNFEFTNDSRKP